MRQLEKNVKKSSFKSYALVKKLIVIISRFAFPAVLIIHMNVAVMSLGKVHSLCMLVA